MRKQNLLSKKISKQIISINNLLESYFNRLRRFIIDIKRLRFDKNNKVFLVIVSIIFLTLVYFLIPTAYNKETIQNGFGAPQTNFVWRGLDSNAFAENAGNSR